MVESILRTDKIDTGLIELLASAYLVLIEEKDGDIVIKLCEKVS